MPNNGNNFRHALAEYIRGWGEGLAVEEEKYIGWRFIGTPRKLDIVIMNPQNCRSMAIEAKLQETSGSAFEKLSYALDDCMAAPIPSIIVFSGRYIRDDMKAKQISSGHGIEVGYENGAIADRYERPPHRINSDRGSYYSPSPRPEPGRWANGRVPQPAAHGLEIPMLGRMGREQAPYAPCRSKRISKYCFAISGWSCSNSDM